MWKFKRFAFARSDVAVLNEVSVQAACDMMQEKKV